jgi:hypothetical protein
MTAALNTLLAVVTASVFAQTTPILNRGVTPPPRVHTDLSVTFFLNAPGASEVRVIDSAHSPGAPGMPRQKTRTAFGPSQLVRTNLELTTTDLSSMG